MVQVFKWAVFMTVLVLTIAVLGVATSQTVRNECCLVLDRVWPHDGGKGMPIGLVRALHPTVPVWVEVEPRLHMRLGTVDFVERTILLSGAWEPATWHGLSEHIPEGGVFVDVGAHIGYYSLKAASTVGPRGRVLAVEPNPETLRKLRANIRESGAESIVTVEPLACSDSDAVLELFAATPKNTGASSLSQGNAEQFGPVTGSYHVRARRLDEIVRESGVTRLDALKIDVEGAELMALKGATETLDRYHPVIAIELIDDQLKRMGASSAEVIAFLRAHGYSLRHIYGLDDTQEFAYTPGLAAQSK